MNEWCKWLVVISFLTAFFLGFFVGTAMPADRTPTLFEQMLEKVDNELKREEDQVWRQRSLTFGLWTQHYAGDHTEGIDNHLIAFEYYGPTLAIFRNSYGNETLFMGYTWHTRKYGLHHHIPQWYVQGNLSVGTLWGYGTQHPIHFGGLSPGLYPTVNVGRGNHSVGLGVMPTFWWMNYRYEF